MKIIRFPLTLAAGCLAILATTAFAHPGHGADGFSAGLAHPLSGVDHLLTMLAIGIWAAQLGKRATWLIPATFLSFMLIGAALAFTGLQLSATAIDQAIATSLLLVGLLVTFTFRMPTSAGASLAALFATFHGYAHGAELRAGLSATSYLAGFALTTASLLLAGIALAILFTRLNKPLVIRFAGLACMTIALLLLGGVL
ncbi:MAG TPA: HupE/UreJ family protein [Phycisphaerae bacterium]|nr:HupE/UreJ family protein [Phycisphaerae bacterium]